MISLKDIISISGKPGLYKIVAQAKNGAIVEALENKKRIPLHSREQISTLDSISIYTNEEEKPLKEIYSDIYTKENGGKAPAHTENIEVLEQYLAEILPNYDRERVYPSNIKKVFLWYNLLHQSGNLNWEEASEEAKEEPTNLTLSDQGKKRSGLSGKPTSVNKTPVKANNLAKPKTITQRKSGGA